MGGNLNSPVTQDLHTHCFIRSPDPVLTLSAKNAFAQAFLSVSQSEQYTPDSVMGDTIDNRTT